MLEQFREAGKTLWRCMNAKAKKKYMHVQQWLERRCRQGGCEEEGTKMTKNWVRAARSGRIPGMLIRAHFPSAKSF